MSSFSLHKIIYVKDKALVTSKRSIAKTVFIFGRKLRHLYTDLKQYIFNLEAEN